jgi:squalene/oxidosqualene cyclase-like protein
VSADAIDRGLAYLTGFQTASGSIRRENDGPLFLLPGYVFARYATGTPIDAEQRRKFLDFLGRAQNEDGSWGLHVEGRGSLFSTVLAYVALRLLGVTAPDPLAARALAWIDGRAIAVPTWGKCWLALLRLYEWDGVHPLPPELWLLPRRFPLHPGRFWCHTRVVHVALSHLYGRRWRVPEAPLLAEIRAELFEAYDAVDWRRARSTVDPGDVYAEPGRLLRMTNALTAALEPRIPSRLRARALAHTLDQIVHEQRATNFVDLGPVNKALDTIVLHSAGSELAPQAAARLDAYLYDGEAGLTMQAYNSSEIWDTAFTAQALVAADRVERFRDQARELWRFLDENQVREDVPERRRYHRERSRGGWAFSDRENGWTVADCTAEALSALLELEPRLERRFPRDRLLDAIDLLLHLQNPDGGWPTYERRRAGPWLERLNASELFSAIMVDYSYVELTSSALQALTAAEQRLGGELGGERRTRIARAIARGAQFIRDAQRPEGSWEGRWGICFTYGAWFGVWGLRAAGATPDDPAIRRAAAFLLDHRLPDGSWGESYESCLQRTYVQHPAGGQPVMTAWAVLALAEAREPEAVARGCAWLRNRQLADGDWPQRSVTGVFNRTCMQNYPCYRSYFPVWALALGAREDAR